MRIASRHMPKYQPKFNRPVAWLFLAILASGLLNAAISSPTTTAIVLLSLCAAFFFSHRIAKRKEDSLRRLAAQREGKSICEFARDFDTRTVDTWILRAVYEQIQAQLNHVHPAFPVRASDLLKEDFHLDDDDLDIELALQIGQRTGRSLAQTTENPLFGEVNTVRDLVLFFQSQPKRGELKPSLNQSHQP